MNKFIKSYGRQLVALVVLISALMFFTPDQAYNIVYTVGGLLILRHSITVLDRYWSRNGFDVSLSQHMQDADKSQRTTIYASIIIAIAYIIGSVLG